MALNLKKSGPNAKRPVGLWRRVCPRQAEPRTQGSISCALRVSGKYDAATAVTATAHKLARFIYVMLKNQTEYRDPGKGYYEERACPEPFDEAQDKRSQRARPRAIKNLERKARRLGLNPVFSHPSFKPDRLPQSADTSLRTTTPRFLSVA